MSKAKVAVAVSGGVDSSTSAALLLEQGYDCTGIYMITHDLGHHAQKDAQAVCDHLGIDLEVLDLRQDFQEIISYFTNEYKNARTPNPCVFCNRMIKFGRLWQYAEERLNADFIATGHYARIQTIDGIAGLYQAEDLAKDQSYVLSMIDRNVLSHILLPISELNKDQTRQLAGQYALPTEHKADSQEICFIPDDDYVAMLQQWCPGILKKGKILDTEGHVLGEHEGICKYTIGQRRGLGIAAGKPIYVIKIDANNNTVTPGSKEDLMSKTLMAENENWLIDKPTEPFSAKIKIRYNHKGAMGTVYPLESGVRIEFNEPLSAMTPGQAAVMYIEENQQWRVAGGAWISHPVKE